MTKRVILCVRVSFYCELFISFGKVNFEPETNCLGCNRVLRVLLRAFNRNNAEIK